MAPFLSMVRFGSGGISTASGPHGPTTAPDDQGLSREETRALIDACVHCGFCLPACPTYALWGQEPDSPRGRIYLMKMASDGTTPISPDWVKHFDTCLGCMACMTACPSGVDYGKLIERTRALIETVHRRPVAERLFRWLIFSLFPRPDRLRLLRPILSAYQKSGLQSLARRSHVFALLPSRLATLEALMPQLAPTAKILPLTPASLPRRARVGLVLGCVARELLSEVNAATVRVLTAEGCEVVAPPGQPCCGALLVHAGEEGAALAFARRMIDSFESAELDLIVVNAGGCGSTLKEYGYLLRHDATYAERAARFSAKCRDVTQFLEELGPRAERQRVKMRVAYHDSCHLLHAQGIGSQPRAQLASIPGVDLVDVPEGTMCCGSAGIYNLVQPETANELADRKADLISQLNVDVVATGNPGCMLQIGAALARRGQSTRVLHTIQIIDASLTGVAPSMRSR